ncbi:hypothetical protein [Plantibacter sp. M259]|uniref:hypothetical protein n=1 Tax=Plantibacter sp. M259 TaxID=2583822 RepID=UPI001F109531|nr:hypothetical protein [Plantibacter sp. M259]
MAAGPGTSWAGVIGSSAPEIWPTLSVNLALQFGIAVLASEPVVLGSARRANASWGRLLQEAQATVTTAPVGGDRSGVAVVMLGWA